jgi:hypothetical protein
MLPRAFEASDYPHVRALRNDLIVKAVSVQGGETDIGGERTAFARIVMTGVDMRDVASGASAPRRQEAAVLKIDDATVFATELHEVVDRLVRSTPTPMVPASGYWSWTSEPLLDEDLLVTRANAILPDVSVARGVAPVVRVDFTGTLVQGLSSADPAVHVQGAVFAGPRQVQTLISSLKKVVRSALEQQRLDIYLSEEESLSAFLF